MFKFIERLAQFLSALVTIFCPLISIPPSMTAKFEIKTQYSLFIDLNFLTQFLQQRNLLLKIILFFISEAANAYFFSLLYNGIHRKYSGTTRDLILLFIVLLLTVSISTMFLMTIMFKNELQSVLNVLCFTFLYFVSSLITVVFFSYEHAVDTKGQKDPIIRFFNKIGNMSKKSIFLLIVLYVFFYVLVLVEQKSRT